MSGIAELLVNLECEVSGSDLLSSPITSRLEDLGVRFNEGHHPDNVAGAQLVVVSAAIPQTNLERVAAMNLGIPVVSRGEMLAELANPRRTIAVVGSHGKTTTTAMVAVMLEAAGFDPTVVVGGRLSAFGSNSRLGRGAFMVVEADESDRSFLQLSPEIAVFTNIDDEHLDAYDGIENLEASFLAFAQRAAKRSCVVACVDDPRLRHVVSQLSGRVVTYGMDNPAADIRASEVMLDPSASRFRVVMSGDKRRGVAVDMSVASPGRHNVQNALAALSVGLKLGVSPEIVVSALAKFRGADRRLQVCGEVNGIVVVDDYGHHPTEIAAVIETVRLRAPARVWVIFQPHRYSRTISLLERFGSALAMADAVVLTEVYAASESPISGATASAVAEAIRRVSATPVRVVTSLSEIPGIVAAEARPGDVVVTLGAGSIGTVPQRIVDALRFRFEGNNE